MPATNWNQYLHAPQPCACGREHSCVIEAIELGEGALMRLPSLLARLSFLNPCVVCDPNTLLAAGNQVLAVLDQAGVDYQKVVFSSQHLVPDETAIGYLIASIHPDCDGIIAVGSGTINDLCRFVSFKLKLPYLVVATASSMDGYASSVAAMTIGGLKITYETHVAKAIVGDLDVLCQAPMHMIAAGVGDILGKYVCLTDWKLSHLLTGEYFCPKVEELVRQCVNQVVTSVPGIQQRDKQAVGAVMEGLVLSGIAMSYIGNSRPASGSEHHLSHLWEMTFLREGKPCALHGTKVGVGTLCCLELYHWLERQQPDWETAAQKARNFDLSQWERAIQRVYGPCAGQVLALEQQVHKNAPQAVEERLSALRQHWDEVKQLASSLPSGEEVAALLRSLQAPTTPQQLGVDQTLLQNSIFYAKELRNRLGLLQLLFDLSFQQQAAQHLISLFWGADA